MQQQDRKSGGESSSEWKPGNSGNESNEASIEISDQKLPSKGQDYSNAVSVENVESVESTESVEKNVDKHLVCSCLGFWMCLQSE